MQGLGRVPVPEGVRLGKVLVRRPQILELQGYNPHPVWGILPHRL